MSKIKKISSLISQTLIILLISLVLSEIAFRIYNKIRPSYIFYERIYNRFRGQPFAADYDGFKLNSRGFKDVEFPETKDENTFRIVAIGDSFAYGVVPYQYNYLTRLEESLKKRGKPVEVLNMGLIGLAPRDYLSLLVNEGLELKPDQVLLSFFIGNDFLENQLLEQRYGRALYTYSYVASFLKFLMDLNQKYEEQIFSPTTVYIDDQETFTDEFYLKLAQDRSWVYQEINDFFVESFDDAMSYLVKIQEICRRQNIELTIVIIPDELQVNRELQGRVIEILGATPENFDFAQPNRMLAAEFNKRNINYIDVLPDFQAMSSEVNLYKPNDSHWNIAGNKLAAEVIEKQLFDQIP